MGTKRGSSEMYFVFCSAFLVLYFDILLHRKPKKRLSPQHPHREESHHSLSPLSYLPLRIEEFRRAGRSLENPHTQKRR